MEEAIDKLGFVASIPARRLASSRSYTVGLIFHNASWPYIQDVQKRGPDRPTAIYCNNDEMAAGAASAIFEAVLKVPEDISVAGFDNNPLARQYSNQACH